MKGSATELLVILTTLIAMSSDAQIKLKEDGFNDVLLGRNIKEVSNVVNFAAFPDRKLFDVIPDEKNYYCWQSEETTLLDSATIRYIFVYTDAEGTIIKLSMWLDDPGHHLEAQLNTVYGKPKTKAQSESEGNVNRDLTLWQSSPAVTLFLAQPYRVDPVLNFQVTKLDFYKSANFNEVSRYIISPRFRR